MTEHLLLKWGTLKGWELKSDEAMSLLQKYSDLGMSMGAAQQQDTPEQKQIICDLIDAVDGEIENDWTGETMTRDEAKKYVLDW